MTATPGTTTPRTTTPRTTTLLARVRRRAGGDPAGFDRRLIAPMILGAVLNPINSSIIAVALIPIGTALGALPSQTAWLVSGLYLATAVGQPVAGRLVDLYGPRRVYLAGTSLIGVGGLLGMVAPSLGVLVVARVVLGLGTCAGYPAAMTLIRREADRTGHDSPAGVLTVLAVAAQTVAVIGPTLGGLLIGVGGWRATFAVNVPLALACLVLGSLRLPRPTPADRDAADRSVADTRGAAPRAHLASTIDLAGIVLFTGALVALLLFVAEPRTAHWYLPLIAGAAGVGFVVRERRATTPFVDLGLLGGNVPLLATFVRSFLAAITSYALLYGWSQWLEEGRGLSPSVTGLILLPVFGTAIGVSTLTGRRPEIRRKLLAGAVGQVAVAGLLLTLGNDSAIWLLVLVALVAGVPQGLNTLANQNAVYHQADPARVGSSAGLMRTFFYLGAIVASTTNGIAFRTGATTSGLHDLALIMLGASLLLLVITAVDSSLAGVLDGPDHDPGAPGDQPRSGST